MLPEDAGASFSHVLAERFSVISRYHKSLHRYYMQHYNTTNVSSVKCRRSVTLVGYGYNDTTSYGSVEPNDLATVMRLDGLPSYTQQQCFLEISQVSVLRAIGVSTITSAIPYELCILKSPH